MFRHCIIKRGKDSSKLSFAITWAKRIIIQEERDKNGGSYEKCCIVYNRSLYSVTPQELTNGTVKVLSTWVGGKKKYQLTYKKNDYDGDRKSDLAVHRDGYWSIYLMAGSVLCDNAPLWVGPDWTPVR